MNKKKCACPNNECVTPLSAEEQVHNHDKFRGKPLLENESVRKYFGDDLSDSLPACKRGEMSERVLHAMQDPINKGDRLLVISGFDGSIREEIATGYCGIIHPYNLRLPARFQEEKKETTQKCGCGGHDDFK
jgi:hypothetical protein